MVEAYEAWEVAKRPVGQPHKYADTEARSRAYREKRKKPAPETRGRVIAHTDHVTLRNAHFVVQRAGYERTIREKVRSVQAWVRGEVTEASEGLSVTPVLVTYNTSLR